MFDTGKTVPVGDTALFVSEAGRPDGAPIVLLHGGLGSRDDFAPLARLLAADYLLIAIDSRGHGRSGIGQALMTYRQLADDIAAVLTQLGLTDAGIIGHSDGAIVALRLAAGKAVAPSFVVAVGAHLGLPEDDPTRGILRNITLERWRARFADQIRQYEAENPDPGFARLFQATRDMWLSTGRDAYPGASVQAITCPLLIIRGDADFLVARAQAFDLAEQVEGALLLNLPFASHAVLSESPEEVLPTLTRFIRMAEGSETTA